MGYLVSTGFAYEGRTDAQYLCLDRYGEREILFEESEEPDEVTDLAPRYWVVDC